MPHSPTEKPTFNFRTKTFHLDSVNSMLYISIHGIKTNHKDYNKECCSSSFVTKIYLSINYYALITVRNCLRGK